MGQGEFPEGGADGDKALRNSLSFRTAMDKPAKEFVGPPPPHSHAADRQMPSMGWLRNSLAGKGHAHFLCSGCPIGGW